jgi:hypothetical protein
VSEVLIGESVSAERAKSRDGRARRCGVRGVGAVSEQRAKTGRRVGVRGVGSGLFATRASRGQRKEQRGKTSGRGVGVRGVGRGGVRAETGGRVGGVRGVGARVG